MSKKNRLNIESQVVYELCHEKTCFIACAASKDSDQPTCACSLIRTITVHIRLLWNIHIPKIDYPCRIKQMQMPFYMPVKGIYYAVEHMIFALKIHLFFTFFRIHFRFTTKTSEPAAGKKGTLVAHPNCFWCLWYMGKRCTCKGVNCVNNALPPCQ